jgi:hypothetical protein
MIKSLNVKCDIKCHTEWIYHTFYTIICTLTVCLLYDTLMMVTLVTEICAHQDFASASRRQLRGVEFFDVITTGRDYLIKKLHFLTDPRRKSLKSPETS